eukprot:TRINITY_DN5877_c0_g1_i1.p1 TRINITY_DN5877_c0_g1~~TRINITY_DN5877_c0_g1_i1.p1  ORF type:complete len:706 (+),score=148.58 TRINITY_DN5877_c0_g1_i1:38-2155(+)
MERGRIRLQHISNSLRPDIRVQNCSAQDPEYGLEFYRKKASFNSEEMKRMIEGHTYEFRRQIFSVLANDPVFKQSIDLDMDRHQLQEHTMKMLKRIVEYGFISEEDRVKNPWKGSVLSRCIYAFDVALSSKFGLSMGMFVSVIQNLGTERHQKYIEDCKHLKMIGCFALTELSHGSNAKSIETTATFDKEKQEFVIHSPSYRSYKWWIGLAGKTSNWACVLAHLVIEDRQYGLHAFLVPIRSMKDHSALPGVTVGDIGTKLGQNGHENGFIGFDHVRIPRENLLNKIADVTREGDYTAEAIPPSRRFAQLLSPLSAGRVEIVGMCNTNMISALTIALRYSAQRVQFGPPAAPEIAVLEYPLQQTRLMPHLSAAFALHFFFDWITALWASISAQMNSPDKAPDYDHALAEIHAISCAAKPVAGWVARDAIQTARECCGGHGYTAYNKLGVLRDDHDPNLTYEGENNVLIQQTSKYLVDTMRRAISGKSIHAPLGSVSFLSHFSSIVDSKLKVHSVQELLHPKVMLEMMQFRVCILLLRSMAKLEKNASCMDLFAAWNDAQPLHLHPTSKAYLELLIMRSFQNKIDSLSQNPQQQKVLQDLGYLFALTRMTSDLSIFREREFASSDALNLIQESILSLCATLKNEAIALVDVIAPPDAILNSPIGMSTGDAHQNLFDRVMRANGALERPNWWPLITEGTEPFSRALP